ncbi:NACHT, LRR and PYD domains-containing protein 1-like protein [Lates japonicus]|nr:NACHT, LRR and PYD domains-containing protein 1-like protein [Lates japonicus]
MVQDQEKTEVWKRNIHLTGSGPAGTPSAPAPSAQDTMMTETDLKNILDDLTDDEFKEFKWELKCEKVDNVPPIKVSLLSKADRQDTVDLMEQKYGLVGALRSTRSWSIRELKSVRTQFISRVSEPVLRKLLDKLLERGVITDDEMDLAGTASRADKARVVIDTVRRKGSEASSALISALCEEDRCLSTELNLT